MSTESLISEELPVHVYGRPEISLTSKSDCDIPTTPATPEEWRRQFVRLVQQTNTEVKLVQSLDTPLERTLDWAVSVASQILSSPSQALDPRRKILQHVVSTSDGVNYLLEMLEENVSSKTAVWLSYILRECANPRNGPLRVLAVRKLIESAEPLDRIIGILVSLQNLRSKEGAVHTTKQDAYNTSVNLIWVLSAMAEKDSKFVMKVRTMSKVKFLHGIMKTYFFGKSHTHYPLLKIFRALARNCCGKKALVQSDALTNLKKFCELCPSEKAFDAVIMKAAGIIYVAYQKDQIQLEDIRSPARFAVPKLQNNSLDKDTGSSSDEDDAEDLDDPDETDEGDGDIDEDAEIITLPEETFNIEEDLIGDEDADTVPKLKPKNDEACNNNEIVVKHGKGDCVSSEFCNLYPPEVASERLGRFASFFRELDGNIESAKDSTANKITLMQEMLSSCESESDEVPTHPKLDPKCFWLTDHPEYGSSELTKKLRSTYAFFSSRTRSVIPFVKIAYPDFVLAYSAKRIEYLNTFADRACLRTKLISHMNRASQELFKPKVVYDLDSLLKGSGLEQNKKNSAKPSKAQPAKGSINLATEIAREQLGNDDEKLVGTFDGRKDSVIPPPLVFESRFESGNLRKAVQVGDKEYDLYLMSDVNSNRHNQWFYFQISNTQENCYYTFNIVNCIKGNSQFNYGMQPVVFSVADTMEGKGGWHRSGSNICYYRNGLRNVASKKKKGYQTATFTLHFSRRGDICYIAYHYPYTYSRMMTEVAKLLKLSESNNNVAVRYDVLCESINHNEVPLLTVTGPNNSYKPIELREVIVLSSRVHPGESNSSWVMHGILHKLFCASNSMESILARYVFKIIPMLNVEGVINGCHRCGLTNEDLNRKWKNPDPVLHPAIYNAKGMIEFCCRVRNKAPVLFCDLHGHSRKKNVFFYGCSKAKSWNQTDRGQPEDPNVIQLLPEAVAKRNAAFALPSCNFDVRKSREATARVTVWREFGIDRSYTLESSYCGCDRGPYKGLSMGIHHLIEVGENLCEAIEEFYNRPVQSVSEYQIMTPQNFSNDPSNINFCNLEDPSWSDQNEAPSPASSETDYGNSETDDEWNQGSLNPVFC